MRSITCCMFILCFAILTLQLPIAGNATGLDWKTGASAQPSLQITMSKSVYQDGDAIAAAEFRLQNPAAKAIACELKVWLGIPGLPAVGILNIGADGSSLILPAGFNQDFGPLNLFVAASSFPRGIYELSSQILSPQTGESFNQDVNFAVLSAGQSVSQASAAGIEAHGLGDIPLDPETYQKNLKVLEAVASLPSSYDARTEGIVTSPKNQGACGSCWAFAATGAMEAHLLKKFQFGPVDLAEQQQNSCNTSMSGCCGGSASSIRYWETNSPIYESCLPYADSGTSCPTQTRQGCTESKRCSQPIVRVVNWHTVTATPDQFKTSLYQDGPSYWRYVVYSDFDTYWGSGGAGTVYTNNAASTSRGGHAVLLIGWDDAKGAYLCKNSWGATGGPNGDGTFWIAYAGHSHDLGFGMANFDLVRTALDITMNQQTYSNGQAVIAPEFKLQNVGEATAAELKVWLTLTAWAPITILNIGADGSFILPAGFNQNFGPLNLLTVSPSIPSGTAEFSSRLVNVVTGSVMSEDRNPFTIQ